MSNQKLKREDLRQGDIILFSPYDDWESKLIAKMTESDVTHSAMSYYTNYEIVEEVPHFAQIAKIKERVEERTIYVMRLDPPNQDMKPVLDIAQGYVLEKAPYSKVNLVFVGIYMLIKKEFLSHTEQKLLTKLLKVITAELINFINEDILGLKDAFVCSQFVFNCYYTAGDEYILKPKITLVTNNIVRQIIKLSGAPRLKNTDITKIESLKEEINVEKILEALYHESNEMNFKQVNMELQDELVDAVHNFSLVYHKAFKGDIKDGESALQKMLEIEEIFITPGDLHKNIKNLVQVGILDNEEVKAL